MKTDNELIAVFMGGSFEKREIITYGGKRNGKWTFPDGLWCYDDHLNYNTSWNMLMPVVEKIEALYVNQVDQFNKTMSKQREADTEFSMVMMLNITASIDQVYKNCVEFIKWYNSQPKH